MAIPGLQAWSTFGLGMNMLALNSSAKSVCFDSVQVIVSFLILFVELTSRTTIFSAVRVTIEANIDLIAE